MRASFRSPLPTIVVIGLLSGCVNETDNPDARAAEHAVGISGDPSTKTVETTRDVTVIKDTKVIDNKTGQTISETKEATPVQVTKEEKERVDVNVNVGETKATTTRENPIPAK